MANALAHETSPYLLQHRDNPVDWLPWGEEAHRRAREGDRPLLVSIGYSACHWCHVMERECFEDDQIAALMNEHFVCVKVDREERPDVDAIYMEAVQGMTGQGGWPLNIFLTPEQVPFYGGTYFPPAPRVGLGMPTWPQVLTAVAEAWKDRKEEIRTKAREIAASLGGGAALRASEQAFDPATLDAAVQGLRGQFDSVNGGFTAPNSGAGGDAPKFPPHATLLFLLARGETTMSVQTLRSMASGGINDQIGGGFARYTVDAQWTVPHFEKMLYDNALLARAYLRGWQRTGDPLLRRTCEETLEWALREMRGPEGGFLSALDADSEGVEGKFYVWTLDELRDVLGPDAPVAITWLGASDEGNFEGANILESRGPEPEPQVRERIRARLLEVRTQRVWPGLDDKRLTAWNALMITALAEAGGALERDDLLDAARGAADFVLRELRDPDGRLLRTWKDGEAKYAAYLEDHAFLLEGLLSLYEATFEERWFTEGRALADTIVSRFADPDHGGFFSVADDHERLVARRKDLEDAPIPSGAASAALGLLRLGALTGEHAYTEQADGVLRLLHELAPRHPQAFGYLLTALDLRLAAVREVALVGPANERAALERVVRGAHRPHVVVAGGEGDGGVVPLLEGRGPVEGRAAAYVCEGFACRAPVTGPDELAAALR